MPSDPFASLKGQAAIVTGSTSGIGQALAPALAEAGRQCRAERPGRSRPDRARSCCAAGADRRPGPLSRRRHDQAGDEIADMVGLAQREFGRIDILVNNAGIQYVAPDRRLSGRKWDQIIAINLSSAFHAIRAAVPP